MHNTVISSSETEIVWKKYSVTILGTLLLFITFTQVGTGGGIFYLTHYVPVIVACLLLTTVLEGKEKPRYLPVFYILTLLIFIANASPDSLRYFVVQFFLFVCVAIYPARVLVNRMTEFAYYAMIVNLCVYILEFILVGLLSIQFDAAVLNYGGSGREGVITTWGISRFSGHHTEPGSLAINLAALTVLSLLSGRKPTFLHWLSSLALVSVLSLTAMILSVTVIAAILVASGIRMRTVLKTVFLMSLGGYVLYLVLPAEHNFINYLAYRLLERGGTDGSIYVKGQLLNHLMNRDALGFIIGERGTSCAFCEYAKSLGFGFNTVLKGGLFGVLGIFMLFTVAWYRLGLLGCMLCLTFLLMRLEFYYPQAVIMTYAIACLPKPRSENS